MVPPCTTISSMVPFYITVLKTPLGDRGGRWQGGGGGSRPHRPDSLTDETTGKSTCRKRRRYIYIYADVYIYTARREEGYDGDIESIRLLLDYLCLLHGNGGDVYLEMKEDKEGATGIAVYELLCIYRYTSIYLYECMYMYMYIHT